MDDVHVSIINNTIKKIMKIVATSYGFYPHSTSFRLPS